MLSRSCQSEDCPADHHPGARVLRWSRPLLVAIVTAALLAWTWPNCPEAITDFGREVYVPWRLSEGEVLYRDLNHFNGPLSPYFNAMMFELLDPSIRSIKIVNATIAILVALLIYWMIRRISDCLTAVVAGITFAVMFAAAHLSGAGNFNWLTPYSHEVTHGIALALAMLACLWIGHERLSWRWIALGGLAFGLVLLTKVEVGVAALCGAATALGVMLIASPADQARVSRATTIVSFILPATIPPILAVLLLSLAMPLSDAARGAAGAWLWIADDRITGLPFFRWVMGTDDVEANVLRLLGWSGAYLALLVVAGGAALLFKPNTRAGIIAAILAAILVAVAMELTWRGVKWSGMFRPLPLVLLLIILTLVMRWLGGRASRERLLPRLSLAVFALALLLKIVLRARAFHYGFALAMPATMLFVALLVWWFPAAVARLRGEPWVARAIVLAVIAVLLRAHLFATQQWMAMRTVPIGRGADRFMTDGRGVVLNHVIDAIARLRRPDDTLVVMPEGIMLNFLLRMPSPSRYQNFLPSEMMIYTERDMLESLRRDPPAFVAIVHRIANEYGAGEQEGGFAVHDRGRFGTEYGAEIAAWLRELYLPVLQSGAMPFVEERAFGALLLRHESSAPARPPTPSTAPTTMPRDPGNMTR